MLAPYHSFSYRRFNDIHRLSLFTFTTGAEILGILQRCGMLIAMQKLIAQKIAATIDAKPEEVSISVPELEKFGHYSTNIAMRLAKQAGKPPLALAEEFAQKLLEKEGAVFARVEAVKPGFINLWLSEHFLQNEFSRSLQATSYKLTPTQTVIVEYSAPNIAKPMHVGHLRSTIIGDALANIYAYLGYNVIRWNYFGDWGTQFGKLIAAYKLWGEKAVVEKDPIKALLALYVRFHDEMKTNPDLERQGQLEFKKLEEGDKENRKLWEWFKDESLLEFKKMYKRLGVQFDVEIGEAFYEEALYDVLKELTEKGLLVPGEEGAKIVNLDAHKLPPALIQKSDGASLYITRDVAGLKHRLSKYKPSQILYVVANEQALHFEQLFAIAQLLGLTSAQLAHIKFGLVLGEDGKKLSTREGRTVQLESIVHEITERAFAVVSEKNPSLPEEERRAVAEAVGIGALKYNDLKENRNSDIIFNWEKMLDFHGDSAPYLQYTVVRLKNIIRKAQLPTASGTGSAGELAAVDDDLKIGLMKKMLDFDDVVSLCVETRYTSHLAKYLFELAKLGNQYYEMHRILEDENKERQAGRLALVGAIAQTLTEGLSLLGIQVPERI